MNFLNRCLILQIRGQLHILEVNYFSPFYSPAMNKCQNCYRFYLKATHAIILGIGDKVLKQLTIVYSALKVLFFKNTQYFEELCKYS